MAVIFKAVHAGLGVRGKGKKKFLSVCCAPGIVLGSCSIQIAFFILLASL
jgi:hypothetical protein